MTHRTRLLLVRHGQTDHNASGRFQGQADVPLNDVGRAQAAVVAARVAGMAADRVVSSDLARAAATAEAIGEACGLPVTWDRRLREIDVGAWSGLSRVEVAAANPWLDEALRVGADFRRSESGETAAEAGGRVHSALAELGERYAGSTSVVVGHGMSLRTGMTMLLGLDLAHTALLSGMWNCSWSVLEHVGRWRLQSYNNVD